MPCSRPGSLPHAAASSTRLEFKESQQRQLFGPSNIGVHLGFPREPARTDPPPHAPLLRKDLSSVAAVRNATKKGSLDVAFSPLPG